jgi:acetyl esterase/lipase
MVLLLIVLATGCGSEDAAGPPLEVSTTAASSLTPPDIGTAETPLETSTTTTVVSPETTQDVGTAEPPFEVLSEVVSHESTQDISVWAPDAEGSWPVVYALPGQGGGQDFAEIGKALASQGVVVFASDYRWDSWITGRVQDVEKDAECGYRNIRSIAADYGGDLSLPVTFTGHSLGATLDLLGGLNNAKYGPDGSYDECFAGAPRPDIIVPLAGCYYEHEGVKFGFDMSTFENPDADLVLVVGADDKVCEPWQSRDATAALQAAGYNAKLVEIDGANHLTVIFHDFIDGEWLTLPDHPAGMAVVQTILDAIDDARSASVQDIYVGVWKTAMGHYVIHGEDGTWKVGYTLESAESSPLTWGTNTFDGAIMTSVTDEKSQVCAGVTAVFEIAFEEGGDVVVATPIDDPCASVRGSDTSRSTRYTP